MSRLALLTHYKFGTHRPAAARAEERAWLPLVAPCSTAAVASPAGPHGTTPIAAGHLEGHANTLRPEVVCVILDFPDPQHRRYNRPPDPGRPQERRSHNPTP